MKCAAALMAILFVAAAITPPVLAQGAPKRAEHLSIASLRSDARFTLTPTQNVWTFLLLDSSNGRVWQVHYSVADSLFSGRLPLNEKALALPSSAHIGRFTLQETQNIFNFLLLDQDDGRVWQIQWSYEESQRGVIGMLSELVP